MFFFRQVGKLIFHFPFSIFVVLPYAVIGFLIFLYGIKLFISVFKGNIYVFMIVDFFGGYAY